VFLFFDIFAKTFQNDPPRLEQAAAKERQRAKAHRPRRKSTDRLR